MRRILICGAPDLNYIDGSSIWAQTLAIAFSQLENVQVDFLAKSTPKREQLYAPLNAANNIRVIDGTVAALWGGKSFGRLNFEMMAQAASKLHETNKYDVVVIRGLDIALFAEADPSLIKNVWLYLTDIPQQIEDFEQSLMIKLRALAGKVSKVLCQSKGFAKLWKEICGRQVEEKIRVYGPLIPDPSETVEPISSRDNIAIYAGKYTPEWHTLRMASLWPSVKENVSDASLIMIGDKIHSPEQQPDFKEQMLAKLKDETLLTWLGALSRGDVMEQLKKAKVGLSWRDESLDDIVEYSTKILEYGAAGCGVVLNRNFLHEELLGKDYPLFANSGDEFVQKVKLALNDSDLCQKAADRMRVFAKEHSISNRINLLEMWLSDSIKEQLLIESPSTLETTGSINKVLVAGHDLKFFNGIQQSLVSEYKLDFSRDLWQGHTKHDERQSLELLKDVNTVFCEWCLGNAVWYSNHVSEGQRLVIRFHAQELRTDYPAQLNISNVDHITFVAEHIRKQALEQFPHLKNVNTSVIPNFIDPNKFTPKKKTGDAQFTLGMIGIAPKMKRLDRAIDLLERLLAEDKRYVLRVKGKNPLSYPWLMNRKDERQYYQEQFTRINGSELLRHKVIFDPPGDDVNDWFQMVGWILSPSEHESFHMAIGEGIATGAIPLIWPWEGAKEIWGEACVFEKLSQMVNVIRRNALPIEVNMNVYGSNVIRELRELITLD